MTPNQPPQHKPVLGLLGAPGSGKSTVAGLLAEMGCGVIDADRLAHDAIQSQPVREQLRRWWGDGVLDAAGLIDRSAVGRIVFNDEAALARLEALLHPLVHAGRGALRERMQADPAVRCIVEDTPLLLESGLDSQCDALVFVDCPLEIRQERVAQSRGWDADQLSRREQKQAPLDSKRQRADYVISTAGGLNDARQQTQAVLQQTIEQFLHGRHT